MICSHYTFVSEMAGKASERAITIHEWLQNIEDVDSPSVEIEGKWERICRWLAAPDPSPNYYGALRKRQDCTGEWFLEGHQFDRWCKEPDSFVWLYGPVDCGKTVLAASVIELCLQRWQNFNGRAVVYFYFDFVETEKRKHEGMLRSLITQLAFQTCSDAYGSESLLAIFEACRNGERQPTSESLLSVLQELIGRFSDVYIILDALDECVERDGLFQDLKEIVGWRTGKLHLLTTSRAEDDDVQRELRKFAGSKTTAEFGNNYLVREDPGSRNREPIGANHQLIKWQTVLMVIEEGSYTINLDAARVSQWVLFQLDQLKESVGGAEIRKAFGAILVALEGKYATTLRRIPEWYRLKVLRILQWLVHSEQPLRLVEIAEFTIADINDHSHLDGGRNSALRSMLKLIPSMVILKLTMNDAGKTEERVQLAHFSVREFLVSDRIRHGPAAYYYIEEESANSNIAETCLAYLLQFNKLDSLTPHIHQSFPLSTYAAKHWATHAVKAGHLSNRLNDLIMELLSSKPIAYINFIQILYSRSPCSLQFGGGKKPVPSPLYYACLNGLTAAVTQLLDENRIDVNRREGAQGSPLHVASARGSVEIVTCLLDRGAVVGRRNAKGETPAELAARHGQEEVAELLRVRERGGERERFDRGGVMPLLRVVESGEEFWAELAAPTLGVGNGDVVVMVAEQED